MTRNAAPSPTEKSPNPARRWAGNWVRKNKVVLPTVLAVMAAIAVGDTLLHKKTDHYDSEIIAGVDAKVVGKRTDELFGRRDDYKRTFELILEQCPEDVEAAGQGHLHQRSFDSKPAPTDCYVDTYAVPAADYDNYKVGEVVVPAGELGDHVQHTSKSYIYDKGYPIDPQKYLSAQPQTPQPKAS
ncbi:MAG TPA: hypothetical protein VLF62_04555 [Candidatus Saccharimonadales bacterium]|nr:hypothetical protein [Candidatus Saccharimonadales bacterium]